MVSITMYTYRLWEKYIMSMSNTIKKNKENITKPSLLYEILTDITWEIDKV